MPSISEYFPLHAWIAAFALMVIAAGGFFLSPALTETVGLTPFQHILLIGVAEFGAAAGLASLVIYYRDPSATDDDQRWRFDP